MDEVGKTVCGGCSATANTVSREVRKISFVYRHTCYNLQLKEKCKHLCEVVSVIDTLNNEMKYSKQ